MARTLRAVLTCLAATFACACSDVTFEGGGELTFTLTADRTSAPVGTEVQFDYEASGTFISGVIIQYGDGALDSIPSNGAQSSAGVRRHAYTEAGEFLVIGRVEDAAKGALTEQITLQIVAPAPTTR
jgi:hypothetical protein